MCIFIDITKVADFWWKKCWYQQNSWGLLRDLYIFWIFFSYGTTMLSFINVGYMWQIFGRRRVPFCPSSVSSPEKPILNSVKVPLQKVEKLHQTEAYSGPCQTSMIKHFWKALFPVGIYMFKVNNRNTRTRRKICSTSFWCLYY